MLDEEIYVKLFAIGIRIYQTFMGKSQIFRQKE